MSTPVLFVVHGMGVFSQTLPGDPPSTQWVDELKEAITKGRAPYTKLAKKELEIVPITYDQVFHQYMVRLAEEGKKWSEVFEGKWVGDAGDFLQTLDDEDANFVATYLADVLLYLVPGLREQIELTVLEQIVARVRHDWDVMKAPDTRYTLVAHSLGTAVACNALDRLARGTGELAPFSLAKQTFRLNGIITLASVWNLFWKGGDPVYDHTLVRPRIDVSGKPSDGFVDRFCAVRHVADPIPWPRVFDASWKTGRYRAIEVRHVHQANVHGFAHYLAHPEVIGDVLRTLYGPKLVPAETTKQAMEDFLPIDAASAADEAAIAKLVANLETALATAFVAKESPGRQLGKALVLLLKNRKALGELGLTE